MDKKERRITEYSIFGDNLKPLSLNFCRESLDFNNSWGDPMYYLKKLRGALKTQRIEAPQKHLESGESHFTFLTG